MADAHYDRDSRRVKKREAEAKNHHNWYERKGPNVIIRTQIEGTRTSFEAEDAFDVSCDNVSHSLNKGKRWEKVANAERILFEQDSPSKTSFVKSSIPRTGVYCLMPNSASEVDPAAVVRNHYSMRTYTTFHTMHNDPSDREQPAPRAAVGEFITELSGGVNQIIEVDNHELSVRNAKSKSATLTGLQSKAGPGPLMKANRHRTRTVKGSKREEEGTLSDPSEEGQHTRYATLEINKVKPKDVERAWRAYQPQNSNRGGWTRKPAADDILDWYSEEQDTLEDELDYFYEDQLESEEPLRFPDQKEMHTKPHSKSYNRLAALFPCEARTCKSCECREHLPLTCKDYERWTRMIIREGIHKTKKKSYNSTRHLNPREKLLLQNCGFCGAEDAFVWKTWCDKCCLQLSIQIGDPIDTHENLVKVLTARAKMMNGEYRQAKMDLWLLDTKKTLEMEQLIEEGVYLFELFAIRRIERETIRKSYMSLWEYHLRWSLFDAMETGGDTEKKLTNLRKAIDDIRLSAAKISQFFT